MTEPTTQPPTLAEVTHALQTIGQAVTDDDVEAYREAVRHAREIGITEHQIVDAYTFRASLRLRTTNQDPVSFTVDGNETT